MGHLYGQYVSPGLQLTPVWRKILYWRGFQAGHLFWWIVDREKAIVRPLKQQGWTKRFVANEPRLSEAVEMYKETGFEVHLQPLSPQPDRTSEEKCEPDAICRQCFEGFEDQYRIIFTRPGKETTERLEDDLF